MPTATTTQSKSKKKTTSRVKKISIEEAEKAKQEAIDKAKEEARLDERARLQAERTRMVMNTPDDADWDEEYDDDEAPSFGHSANAYYEDTDPSEEPDIFEFGRELEEQGKDISYYIKKDNAFLTEIFTATTMEELKKKYGGGKYTVAIKNDRGQWIKRKTMRIHGPIEPPAKEEKETIIPPQPQVPQIDMNQTFGSMMSAFMQLQEMNERNKTRNERDDKKSSDSFNSTLFNVISEQGKSTQQMIMEMQRNNMEMLKAMSENTSRSLEKAEERNREMIREMRQSMGKKEEFGLKEMLALIESSRNNGMDTMKTVMELSETFAEMRTPDVSSSSDDNSKSSLLEKMFTSFAPLITKAAQQQQMPGVAPQQMPMRPALPQANLQHRRRVQQPIEGTQAPQAPQSYPNQRNGAPQAGTTKTSQSPISGPGQYKEHFVGENKVQNKPKSPLNSLGLPSFTDKPLNRPQVSPVKKETFSPQGALGKEFESSEDFLEKTLKDLNTIPEAPFSLSDDEKKSIEEFKAIMPFVRENSVYKKASKNQQMIVELGLPIIAQFINDETVSAQTVAFFVLEECQGQGFSSQVVEKEFTIDFLLRIASNFGIGDEKKQWFGEFYETIQNESRESASGEEEHFIG